MPTPVLDAGRHAPTRRGVPDRPVEVGMIVPAFPCPTLLLPISLPRTYTAPDASTPRVATAATALKPQGLLAKSTFPTKSIER